MKKIVTLLMAIILVFSLVTVGHAEDRKEYLENISIVIPDGYEKLAQNEKLMVYLKEETSISVEVIKDEVLSITDIREISVEIFDIYDADYILSLYGMENSGAQVRFSNKSLSYYCTAKGIPILKFYQNYEISLEGYDDYDGTFMSVVFLDGSDLYILGFDQPTTGSYDNTFDNLVNSIELGQEKYAALPDGTIKILVNSEVVTPENPPIIVNDRTLCPIRAVAEKLGFNVEWDAETKTVTIKNDIREIKVVIGEERITGSYYNGNYRKEILWSADVPAQIINGSTYLPLRSVSEALDCPDVYWNADKRTVVINSKPLKADME